ncbi:MAG: GCN5-related N-acetyltransferase [Chloroflexi bacterium OLB15]|nr:MAG: GCN5-related N-acetyltransferase [Chloroflexi bacterium OLB15]
MPGHENPILLNFPDSFNTDRLTIRAYKPGDGQPYFEAMEESRAALETWLMPWVAFPNTLEESETRARRLLAKFILREDLSMVVERKNDGFFVGAIGLHRINWSVPVMEIGYWVRASLAGQGYVTEAVKGLAQFAFEQLEAERIEIRCDPLNEKSVAVARRAGFTLEGTLRHTYLNASGDGFSDTHVFALLRGGWKTSGT